ncbi:hypothetical protein ACFLRF_02250 [Candidatus Altiarchaeota archaeon]
MALSFFPPIIYLSSIVFASFFLVLPGICVSLLLPKKKITWPEFIGISVMTGLSLNYASVFFIHFLQKVPITQMMVLSCSLTLSFLLLVSKILLMKRSGVPITVRDIFRIRFVEHGRGESIFFTAAILLILFMNLGVHSDYSLPFHMDEWLHLALSVQVIEEQGLKFVEPYYPPTDSRPKTDYSNHRLEAGYHVLIASFSLLSGFNPVETIMFLPALIYVLVCVNLYIMVYAFMRDHRPALYSMIFFAGLKTSISLLGPWLLVPHTLGFAYIYFIYYCFEKGRRGLLGMHIIGMLNLLGAALIHPQTAAILYLGLSLYAILSIPGMFIHLAKVKDSLAGRIKATLHAYKGFIIGIILYLVFPMTGFTYFLKILWKGSLEETVTFFFTKFIYFRMMLEIPVLYTLEFPLEHYGQISAVFFIIGVLAHIFNKRCRLFISSAIVCYYIVYLFHTEGYTVFMAYERVLYYCFLFMIPLSGIGLARILTGIESLFDHEFTPLLTSGIVLLILLSMINGFYSPKENLPQIVREYEYDAIDWLSMTGGGKIVLARARVSNAIYPVSLNKIVAQTPRGSGYSHGMKAIHQYYMGRCDERRKVFTDVLTEYTVDYVIDRPEVECDFLEPVYEAEQVAVYKVNMDKAYSHNVTSDQKQ